MLTFRRPEMRLLLPHTEPRQLSSANRQHHQPQLSASGCSPPATCKIFLERQDDRVQARNAAGGFLAVSSEIKQKLRQAAARKLSFGLMFPASASRATAVGSCRRVSACEDLPLALPETPQTVLFRATRVLRIH